MSELNRNSVLTVPASSGRELKFSAWTELTVEIEDAKRFVAGNGFTSLPNVSHVCCHVKHRTCPFDKRRSTPPSLSHKDHQGNDISSWSKLIVYFL